jgi:hypothetical protein
MTVLPSIYICSSACSVVNCVSIDQGTFHFLTHIASLPAAVRSVVNCVSIDQGTFHFLTHHIFTCSSALCRKLHQHWSRHLLLSSHITSLPAAVLVLSYTTSALIETPFAFLTHYIFARSCACSIVHCVSIDRDTFCFPHTSHLYPQLCLFCCTLRQHWLRHLLLSSHIASLPAAVLVLSYTASALIGTPSAFLTLHIFTCSCACSIVHCVSIDRGTLCVPDTSFYTCSSALCRTLRQHWSRHLSLPHTPHLYLWQCALS